MQRRALPLRLRLCCMVAWEGGGGGGRGRGRDCSEAPITLTRKGPGWGPAMSSGGRTGRSGESKGWRKGRTQGQVGEGVWRAREEGGDKQKEGEGRKDRRKEGTKDFLKLCRKPRAFSLWGDLKEKFNFFQRILFWIFFPQLIPQNNKTIGECISKN